jgi:membrane peptidoglycan carboxypeptidase
MRASTAARMRYMMGEVARYGTARSSFRYIRETLRFGETEYGGKTGTVDKDSLGKVDWFIGFIRHHSDPRQRLAVSVVTVHNENWTVHSSFIGAELMRRHINQIQRDDRRRQDRTGTVTEGKDTKVPQG